MSAPLRKPAYSLAAQRRHNWRWHEKQRRILARDDYRCRYCGTALTIETLTLDHVVPKSRGGGGQDWNLVSACVPCNTKKKDKDAAWWAEQALKHRELREAGKDMPTRENRRQAACEEDRLVIDTLERTLEGLEKESGSLRQTLQVFLGFAKLKISADVFDNAPEVKRVTGVLKKERRP